jgi:hypothetical protein
MTFAGSIVSTRRVKIDEDHGRRVKEPRLNALLCPELVSDQWRQDIQQQPVGLALFGNRTVARPFQFTQHLVALEQLPAQFQMHHCLPRQSPQRLLLLEGQFARLEIDHAERAERVTIPGDEWNAAVEAQAQAVRHKRAGIESRILRQVGNMEDVVDTDRGPANRNFSWAFGQLCGEGPILGLDPLPRCVDEAHQRGGAVANLRRQFGDLVEAGFRKRVDDGVVFQRFEASRLIGWGQSVHDMPRAARFKRPWPRY